MQRICSVAGGIKSYQVAPHAVLTETTRQCPFCSPAHRLRQHGRYERWGIFPDPEPPQRVRVLRLLCVVVGRTVSLLPDFCLPLRQHGPEILGPFVYGVGVEGMSLSAALRRQRRGARHNVACHLWRGFERRVPALQVYAAGFQVRAPTVPDTVAGERRAVAQLVLSLAAGHSDVAKAFRHHGRLFHCRFGLSVA